MSIAPRDAESVLFLRPSAVFSDPRLGELVARSLDEAGETAFIRRAERDGFDVRTIERAVVVWTPRAVSYFAAGAFDAARVGDRLWERLLLPRQRRHDGPIERMEGLLGRSTVALLLDGGCRTAAYLEGTDTRTIDRLLVPNALRDPDALLVWRARQVPEALAGQTDVAVVREVHELELHLDRAAAGLRVELRLTGAFDPSAVERVRGAVRALVGSPLGDLAGAIQWLDPSAAVASSRPNEIELRATIPWRAALAVAVALRGDTRVGRRLEKPGRPPSGRPSTFLR